MTGAEKYWPRKWIYTALRMCKVARLFFDRAVEALMLGASARPEEGSADARDAFAGRRPRLRSDSGRPADSSERAFEILDKIERAGPEDERLAGLVEAAQAGDPFAFAE